MGKYKVIGQMHRTPTNRDTARSDRTFCKSCGRPITGVGRYHEQCDRCYRQQLRQDANGSEVAR